MATVIDYLNKKREEDPSLSGLTYRGVYSKLQEANDPYLPEWEAVTTASSKPSGQTSYERKADPDFVNSLLIGEIGELMMILQDGRNLLTIIQSQDLLIKCIMVSNDLI